MSDGVELHVVRQGDGPQVLWLPGGPGLDNYLAPVARDIAGLRHIAADPRGTGSSAGGPHDLRVAVRDLEDLRRALHLDAWTVVGHSWGADLALGYALQHPEAVASVVSFAGTGVQNDRDWHAAYERRLDDEPHGSYRHSPDVQQALLADWRRFIKTPNLLARIARLSVPITFVHAANDIRPGWPAHQLAELTPHGRFVELAEAPHEAWLTHRDAVLELLTAILERTVHP